MIITSRRNMLFPETVEALSIVLEGYKNKMLHWTVEIPVFSVFCVAWTCIKYCEMFTVVCISWLLNRWVMGHVYWVMGRFLCGSVDHCLWPIACSDPINLEGSFSLQNDFPDVCLHCTSRRQTDERKDGSAVHSRIVEWCRAAYSKSSVSRLRWSRTQRSLRQISPADTCLHRAKRLFN